MKFRFIGFVLLSIVALFGTAACDLIPGAKPKSAPEPSATTTSAPTHGEAPALWKITDADSTMWLMGSVHVLKPDTKWRTPEMDEAFKSANRIWFEVDIDSPQGKSELERLVRLRGVIPAGEPRLLERLDGRTAAQVRRAAAANELPDAYLNDMRPWLASLTLITRMIQRMGYDETRGVDRVLSNEAALRRKDVRYLETVGQQIESLAGASETVQIEELRFGLKELDEDPEAPKRLISQWLAGDTVNMERELLEDREGRGRAAYDRTLTARNRAWIPELKRTLDGAGVDFVVAGAAHFIGPDSVIAMLESDGIKVERVSVSSP
jgi:uncharacterized protein